MDSQEYLRQLFESRVASLRLQNESVLRRAIKKLEEIKISEVKNNIKNDVN